MWLFHLKQPAINVMVLRHKKFGCPWQNVTQFAKEKPRARTKELREINYQPFKSRQILLYHVSVLLHSLRENSRNTISQILTAVFPFVRLLIFKFSDVSENVATYNHFMSYIMVRIGLIMFRGPKLIIIILKMYNFIYVSTLLVL